MNQTALLFNNAELAFASYATLQSGKMNSGTNMSALAQTGMSAKQAEEFAKRYPEIILPTYHDATSDLDVTVFKDPSGHWLYGGDGDGTLAGRESNDCLEGNFGNDMLTGGKDTRWRIAA